jgi:hypothetical protein
MNRSVTPERPPTLTLPTTGAVIPVIGQTQSSLIVAVPTEASFINLASGQRRDQREQTEELK